LQSLSFPFLILCPRKGLSHETKLGFSPSFLTEGKSSFHLESSRSDLSQPFSEVTPSKSLLPHFFSSGRRFSLFDPSFDNPCIYVRCNKACCPSTPQVEFAFFYLHNQSLRARGVATFLVIIGDADWTIQRAISISLSQNSLFCYLCLKAQRPRRMFGLLTPVV